MKKIVGLMIVLVMLFTSVVYAGGCYPGASDWATEELDKASQNGIDNEYYDYSYNISRVQFAELIMNMYNQMIGKYPNPAPSNTFADTTDKNVLMANAVGIINGKGNGTFAPYDYITRQEMAIMMSRALDSMNVDYYKGDGVLSVADKASVASWAVSGVDFAFENGFMKGDGTNFKPLDNTPIEQAVIIVNRVFEKYRTVELEPSDYTKGYDVYISDNQIFVKFHNNGEIINLGRGNSFEISDSDDSKLYFLTYGKLSRYNFTKDKVDLKYHHSTLHDFELVNGGEYDGYVGIKTEDTIRDLIEYTVLDDDLKPVAKIDKWTSMKDLKKKIAQLESQDYAHDHFVFYSDPDFSCSENYIEMTQSSGSDYNKTPIAFIKDDDGDWNYNNYGGTYEVDVCLSSDEENNAGIVFNVCDADHGYNNFLGFYAGIDAGGDKVMLRRGESKANGDWKFISNQEVGFDIKKDKYYTLKVVKNGSDINVYLDDKLYIEASDDSFMDVHGAMFGVRTWNKGAKFKNYSFEKLPY